MNDHLLQTIARVRGLRDILEIAPEVAAVTILDNGKVHVAVGVANVLADVVFGVENIVLEGTDKVGVGRAAVAA